MVSLVTGGAGFIGSHLVDLLVDEGEQVIVVDKLTYASNLENLSNHLSSKNLIFLQHDICETDRIFEILQKYNAEVVYHLAAETHVDNSIGNPFPFIQTNIMGTYSLLTASHRYWNLNNQLKNFRFIHISTDEVFGDLSNNDTPFLEITPYSPSSPYSASKASSDHLVRAWNKTYGLPTIVTNCSNNFGPRQHREKLIPVIIHCALKSQPIPIYGTGQNIRDWLYVGDHCKGLYLAAKEGKIGEDYCFGGGNELTNINLAYKICHILDKLCPRNDHKSYTDLITFIVDRQGHDWRYAVNYSKASLELGYAVSTDIDQNLEQTILFYLNHIKSVHQTSSLEKEEESLELSKNIDFSSIHLDYEEFKKLARNPHLSGEERIGFSKNYREGFEKNIVEDISNKLNNFEKANGSILDIGCGASQLTADLIKLFVDKKLKIFLNDSQEMLSHIRSENLADVTMIPGKFPASLGTILSYSPEGFEYILCYSVLHYIIFDCNIFDFIDSVVLALKPGGYALIGDIPNISKRKRFFASKAGIDFHKNFIQMDIKPNIEYFSVEKGKIDESILNSLIDRARVAGCDAYLLPQNSSLPMHNRRDDIIIRKP